MRIRWQRKVLSNQSYGQLYDTGTIHSIRNWNSQHIWPPFAANQREEDGLFQVQRGVERRRSAVDLHLPANLCLSVPSGTVLCSRNSKRSSSR